MNKNIFIILIPLFTLIIFVSESKGQQNKITGMYENHPFKKYNNKYPYGQLEILKVSKDKFKFWLYCVLGEPSHNQGELKGIAIFEKGRAVFKDDKHDCEFIFIFKKNSVEVEARKLGTCGSFGNNVNCGGIYKFRSRKLEFLKETSTQKK